MRTAYFDCFAGASGDMILGALVDAGAPLEEVESGLGSLSLAGYRISSVPDQRGVMTGSRLSVHLEDSASDTPRSLHAIHSLLRAAALPDAVRDSAMRIFERLAAVESRIHGISIEEVHFHEVGAVDAIVDVVGTLLALRTLAVDQVYCSPFPCARGAVQASHGVLPLPAPATLALIADAGAPITPPPVQADGLGELVTPTAAAILTTLATFQQPAMRMSSVGYGLGARDHPALPNVLRVWIGEETDQASAGAGVAPQGVVQLLETNLDDMPPEQLGYVVELLFESGALDVWFTPIQMKKNRPGVQLNVLSRPKDAAEMSRLILRETTTLGIRTKLLDRWEAAREVVQFESSLGSAAVKVKRLQGQLAGVAPEYDVCRLLARQHGLSLREVYRLVEAEGWSMLEAMERDG